jgi:hypothetical protein
MIVACSKLALERISRAVLAEPCQKQVLRESCCGEIAAGYEIRGIGASSRCDNGRAREAACVANI